MLKNVKELTNHGISKTTKLFGFWSALLTTFFVITFMVVGILFPTPQWTGIESYAASFNPIWLLQFIPAFLLALTFVMLIACIHYYACEEKKILTMLGLAFAIGYMLLVNIVYFVQFTVIPQNIGKGNLDGLSLLVLGNWSSVMCAADMLGFFFMGIATIFVAPIFSKGKIEFWIRWLLIACGILGILTPIAYAAGFGFQLWGLLLWCLIFPVVTILLSLLFIRREA